jgi:hypothetical protein
MVKVKKIDLHKEKVQEPVSCNSCNAGAVPKKKKQNKPTSKVAIFAVVLVAVFILSFVGFKLVKQPEVINTGNAILTIYTDTYYTYNNFEFKYIDKLWVTEIYHPGSQTQFRIPLHYGPKDLLDVEIDKNMISFLGEISRYRGPDGKHAVYVTYDPDVNSSFLTLSYYELSQNLRDTIGVVTYPTFTKEVDSIENETIKTCDSPEPVIYMRYTNPAYVDYEGNCLIIQGEEHELIKAVDRALLQLYGVMQ